MKEAIPIKRPLTSEERVRELAMMRQQYLGGWPMWPYLPIKRSMTYGAPDHGMLVDVGPLMVGVKVEPIIYDFYIWSGQPIDMNKVKARYNSLEELVDDGWVVD